MRRLCATVLVFEAIVIGLAIPVAITIEHEPHLAAGLAGGVLAVVGGTDVFGVFLTIGYDAFYLTRTEVSIPRGRPVFPGVGTRGVTAEEIMKKNGLVLRGTKMLDASVNCRVEEWGPATA